MCTDGCLKCWISSNFQRAEFVCYIFTFIFIMFKLIGAFYKIKKTLSFRSVLTKKSYLLLKNNCNCQFLIKTIWSKIPTSPLFAPTASDAGVLSIVAGVYYCSALNFHRVSFIWKKTSYCRASPLCTLTPRTQELQPTVYYKLYVRKGN